MKKLVLILLLIVSSVVNAQMNQVLNTFGKYQIRADACGTNNVSCPITIEKPLGATTVHRAFIYYTSNYTFSDQGPNAITIDGGGLPPTVLSLTTMMNDTVGNGDTIYTYYSDITLLLDSSLNGAIDGTNITYNMSENVTQAIDGSGLIVVWNNPTITTSSIYLSLGLSNTVTMLSDSFITNPINTTNPLFVAKFGLGFPFSGGLTTPTVDEINRIFINSQLIDTLAGGYDDGNFQNGQWISLGGFGDSLNSIDDELYDISSFINNGDTQIKYGIIEHNWGIDDFVNVVYIELTGVDPPITTINITICIGDSVFLDGAFQNTAGSFTDSLIAFAGHDSVVVTNLYVEPFITTNLTIAICQGDSILINGNYESVAGNYNNTLTSAFGCDSTIITTLNIKSVDTTKLVQSICSGDSILLGGAFQLNTGTYYDTLQSLIGCDSILETVLTISSSVSIASFNPDSVCYSGGLVTLPVGSPTGGFYFGNGVGGGFFDPLITNLGTFDVVYTFTDSNSCTTRDTATITVKFCVGIDESNDGSSVLINPNPTKTHFTIEGINKPYKLSIYNAVGQLLYQEKINEQSKKVDVSNYAKGILFIKIEAEGEVVYRKVVRQ